MLMIAKGVQGWFEIGDMIVLSALIRKNQPMKILEIGSWKGRSTSVIILSAPENAKIVCVDSWEDGNNFDDSNEIKGEIKGIDTLEQFKKQVLALINTYRPDVEVEFMRIDSKHFVFQYEEEFKNSFDFIFVDGDHSYVGVKHDVMGIMPMLKENGILCGHDCHVVTPGVFNYLKEEMPFVRVVKFEDPNIITSVWSTTWEDVKKNFIDNEEFWELRNKCKANWESVCRK